MKAKKKIRRKKKEVPLKISGDFSDVLKIAVKKNTKFPEKPKKKE